MKNALLALAVLAVYALHQDFWLWSSARPLVFGFVPIGLFYHAAYSVLAALLMWLLVTHAWPSQMEQDAEPDMQERSLPPTWGRIGGGVDERSAAGVDERSARERSK